VFVSGKSRVSAFLTLHSRAHDFLCESSLPI
jgi:hypothetical protein